MSLDPPRLFWLGSGATALPCLSRGPASGAKATVMIVSPFAEEMNRCRLWLTKTAVGLAENGVQTLVFDLPGTGDSPMAFGDATWSAWVDATRRAYAWANRGSSVFVLGVRFGALLAAAIHPDHLILAAPVDQGAQSIRGLLRAGGLSRDVAGQWNEINQKGYATFAGYCLNKSLADAVSQQKMDTLLTGWSGRKVELDLTHLVHPWIQIEPDQPDEIAAATVSQIISLVAST